MGRGLCLVALAVAAISSGSAVDPKPNTHSEHKSGAQEAANTVANALRETRPDKDVGCQDRKDKRSSDLCAQWKAADAARDAADYTFIAVIFSFVGTVLVAGTLLYNIYTSRRELRAYVQIFDYRLTPIEFDKAGTGRVHIGLKNYGQTPAVEATPVVSYGFVIWDGERMRKPVKWAFVGSKNPVDIAPGGEIGREASFRAEGFHHLAGLANGTLALCVEICVSYYDIFGNRREQTTLLWSRGALYNAGKLVIMEQAREVTTLRLDWLTYRNLYP
jgi:hypothetical protein